MINRIFSNQMIESVGWAVVHSLWQSALLAIILAIAFGFIHKRRAVLRHNLAYGTLVLCLLGFVSTFIWYFMQGLGSVEITGTVAAPETQTLSIAGTSLNLTEIMEKYLPVVFNVWLVGFILVAAKMMGGWAYMDNLRRKLKGKLDEPYQLMMRKLQDEMKIQKHILLAFSDRVNSPMVAGYFKPVILIPFGLVNNLTDKEVEAILAHELAHIKRNDFILNLIQTFIETILYFNPAVWWISSTVKNTREHCCDDQAIARCGSQLTYANALVKAEEWKQSRRSERIFALSLLGQKENLLNRIKRILQQPDKNALAMEKILLSAGLLFCMVFFNFPKNDVPQPEDETTMTVTVSTNAWDNILPLVTVTDSTPTKKVIETITRKENDKEVQATYENGELKELKIDGKTIPESEFSNYKVELEQIESERSSSGNEFYFRSIEGLEELKNLKNLEELRSLEHLKGLEELEKLKFVYPDNMDGLNYFEWNEENGQFPHGVFGEMHDAHSYSITTEKSDDGKVIMKIETDGDGEIMEIELDSDQDFFMIDGNEIKIGDEAEIIDQGRFKKRFHFMAPGQNFQYQFDDEKAQEAYDRAMEKLYYIQEHQYENMEELYKKMKEQGIYMDEEKMEQMQIEVEQLVEEYQDKIAEGEYYLLEGENLKPRQYRIERELRETERELRDRKERLEDQERAIIRVAPESDAVISTRDFAFFNSERDVNGRLEREMVRDGLIEEGEAYTLKFSGNKLRINGKKQSDEVYEKYKEIYEAYTGSEISKSKIVIENN